jgi:DNA mismatch repair protein MSH6
MSAKPVPKGQSSLFSFFKKGPAPIAVDISANAPNISSPVADPVKDSLPVPPPPKKPKRDDIDSIPGPEIIGKRVKMFWPNDDEWYAGTFIGYEASSARHVVAYDDGQREILDLKMERV